MPKQVQQPMPAPASMPQEGAPESDPNVTGGLDMTRPSEEMRRGVLDEVKKLRTLQGSFNAEQFVNNNKFKEMNDEATNTFFKMLSDMGVDPTDLSSINEFLQKLEETDPDLFVIFERAFSQLMGEENGGEGQESLVPEEGEIPGEGENVLGDKLAGLQQSVQRQSPAQGPAPVAPAPTPLS